MIQDFYEGFEIVEITNAQDERGFNVKERNTIGLGVGAFSNKSVSQIIVAEKGESKSAIDLVCDVNDKIDFGVLIYRPRTLELFKVINKANVNNAPLKSCYAKGLAVYTCERVWGMNKK